jgi:hypothetical protein
MNQSRDIETGVEAIEAEVKPPQNAPPENTCDVTSDPPRYVLERIRELQSVPIELQVRDIPHARSEEVLQYCLKELNAGTTYNDLRLKLGLGTAGRDRRWREIRTLLAELILPESEEEALKASHALSNFMIDKLEKFQARMAKRAEFLKGAENEAAFLKLELDAMKLIMDKYDTQTLHYLKMKELQRKETRNQGQTIIFNNQFHVPRPGDQLQDAARLVVEARRLEGEDE